jgi:hypothetical protein
MKYCYINEDNFHYFKPLLQTDQRIRMMSDPSLFGIGCYDKDTACGILLYTMNDEQRIVRIIYVAVSMSYQRQGIAGGMISSLAGNAYEEGYMTLSNFYAKGTDDPRYAMFEDTDEFTIEQLPGGVYVMSGKELKDVVYSIPPADYDSITEGTLVTISECSGKTRNLILEKLEASGIGLPKMMPNIDEELSFAVIDKDGVPQILVIISYFPQQHMYEVSYAEAAESDKVSDLLSTLKTAVTEISDRMQPEDILRFSTSVASVDRLAQKYFPEEFKCEFFYRAGYDGDTVG